MSSQTSQHHGHSAERALWEVYLVPALPGASIPLPRVVLLGLLVVLVVDAEKQTSSVTDVSYIGNAYLQISLAIYSFLGFFS